MRDSKFYDIIFRKVKSQYATGHFLQCIVRDWKK